MSFKMIKFINFENNMQVSINALEIESIDEVDGLGNEVRAIIRMKSGKEYSTSFTYEYIIDLLEHLK